MIEERTISFGKGVSGRLFESGRIAPKKKGRSVAILVHAFSSLPREFLGLREELLKKGVSVFEYENGLSKNRHGSFWRVSLKGEVGKLKKIVGRLSRKYRQVFLAGASFGGLLAELSFSRKVSGIALWYPLTFPSESNSERNLLSLAQKKELERTGYVRLGGEGEREEYRLSKRFLDELGEANPENFARKIRCPVLIIHGEADTFVRIDQSERLLSLLPQGKSVLVSIGDGVGHVWWKPEGGRKRDEKVARLAVSITSEWISKW